MMMILILFSSSQEKDQKVNIQPRTRLLTNRYNMYFNRKITSERCFIFFNKMLNNLEIIYFPDGDSYNSTVIYGQHGNIAVSGRFAPNKVG